MADRKISDLTALTTPASGDYLPIVDISEASAANKNKRITIEELLRGAPDGTAGAPGIGFESDPNTGIYRPGADQLALSTNGVGRLFVDASGNISAGISPATILGKTVNVYGGTSEGASVVLQANSGSEFCTLFSGPTAADPFALISKSGFKFATASAADATGYSEKLRITSAGLVGIGTSSVNTTLEVLNSSTPIIRVGDGTRHVELRGGSTTQNAAIGTNYGGSFDIIQNGTAAVTIDASKRVLVGTSSDSGGALLQVNGNRIRVATAKTPSSASDTGTAGEICWDADYIYVCTATNTWKRTAISTWP